MLPGWDDPDRRDAALLRIGAAAEAQDWLTRRQFVVVFLLSHGMGYQEIADTLELTYYTARYHARLALHRLDARTRAHAVATALRLGLFS